MKHSSGLSKPEASWVGSQQLTDVSHTSCGVTCTYETPTPFITDDQ